MNKMFFAVVSHLAMNWLHTKVGDDFNIALCESFLLTKDGHVIHCTYALTQLTLYAIGTNFHS